MTESPNHAPIAVIFDMDGVLLDSEPLHFAALNEVLGAEGHTLTEADNEHILGTTLEDTFRHVAAMFPLKDAPEAYCDRYHRTVLRILGRPLEPSPGVVELLERLQAKRIPVALASSSRRAWVEATLKSLGVRRFFKVVVSGDEIGRGKPEPDIYVRTAEMLGVAPERCVAIEDAPNGILSATRAGMTVIAVRTPYTSHLPLEGADMTVDTLEGIDVGEIISQPM